VDLNVRTAQLQGNS